ncbi:MAG TPA: transcriptional regulator [Lactobacillus sp.]|nr:transcriptional regulator [Lactobacillus sp.]
MLTIRKFAELAGTTRRTLLFYDDQNLFKPVRVAANGYRYYDYDQLYDLSFILELRKLGLSVAQIKALLDANQQNELDQQLHNINQKIDTQIQRLNMLKQTLTQRFSQENVVKSLTPVNEPVIINRSNQQFWRSIQSVTCTDEEISQLYQDFYQKIGTLKLIDKRESGFMTTLPNCEAADYETASFCIIKEVSPIVSGAVPMVNRPAGEYVAINTVNTYEDVCHSLKILQDFIQLHSLEIDQTLWQLNLNEQLASKAGSAYMSLEYRLLDQ